MASIGTVTKTSTGSFKGQLRTLSIRTDIEIFANTTKANTIQPDYRVVAGGIEIGAGWRCRCSAGRSMTPDKLEQEIARVAIAARQAHRDTIERANTTITAAIAGVERVTESAWTASNQWRSLCLAGGTCNLASMMLTSALVSLL